MLPGKKTFTEELSFQFPLKFFHTKMTGTEKFSLSRTACAAGVAVQKGITIELSTRETKFPAFCGLAKS